MHSWGRRPAGTTWPDHAATAPRESPSTRCRDRRLAVHLDTAGDRRIARPRRPTPATAPRSLDLTVFVHCPRQRQTSTLATSGCSLGPNLGARRRLAATSGASRTCWARTPSGARREIAAVRDSSPPAAPAPSSSTCPGPRAANVADPATGLPATKSLVAVRLVSAEGRAIPLPRAWSSASAPAASSVRWPGIRRSSACTPAHAQPACGAHRRPASWTKSPAASGGGCTRSTGDRRPPALPAPRRVRPGRPIARAVAGRSGGAGRRLRARPDFPDRACRWRARWLVTPPRLPGGRRPPAATRPRGHRAGRPAARRAVAAARRRGPAAGGAPGAVARVATGPTAATTCVSWWSRWSSPLSRRPRPMSRKPRPTGSGPRRFRAGSPGRTAAHGRRSGSARRAAAPAGQRLAVPEALRAARRPGRAAGGPDSGVRPVRRPAAAWPTAGSSCATGIRIRTCAIRFRGEPARAARSSSCRRCACWPAELIADGSPDRVAFDTYEREIERYGGRGRDRRF